MRRLLAALAAATGLAAPAGAAPGSLLVFYGWPSTLHCPGAAGAADFADWDHVVLGAGLEVGAAETVDGRRFEAHPEHGLVAALVPRLTAAGTRVYGYVALGTNGPRPLSAAQVGWSVGRWAALGVNGVLLDEFGHDYGVSRARQNAAVDAVHAAGLVVIANAWAPADAFAAVRSPSNPDGTAPRLRAGDFYLFESHAVRLSEPADPAGFLAKLNEVRDWQARTGVGVMSITTARDGAGFDEALWHYAWYAAAAFGHAATGWGDPHFAAVDGQACPHGPPPLPGRFRGAAREVSPGVVERPFDGGRLRIDTFRARGGLAGTE